MPLPPYLLERLKKRKIILEEKPEPQVSAVTTKTQPTHQDRPTPDQGQRSGQSSLVKENHDEEIIAEDYSDSCDENDQIEDGSDQSSESDESGERCSRGNGNKEDEEDSNDNHVSQNNESRLLKGPTDYDNALDDNNDTHDVEPCKSQLNSNQNNEDERADSSARIQFRESVLGCPHKYNIYHECTQYCLDRHGNPENMAPTLEQRKQLALLLRTFPMTNDWSIVYDPGVRTFYFWNILSNHVSWYPPGMSTFTSPSADQIRQFREFS